MTRNDKEVKADKVWRGAALVLLCGLVYYFSYDHGRRSVQFQFESYKQEAVSLLESQRQEILNLHTVLSACQAQSGPEIPATERIALRVNQSSLLYQGRLVLTLLKVESADNKALVQLNFLEEEKLVEEELQTGGSLRFNLDGRDRALVLNSMTISSVNFNLVELKE